MVSIPDASSCAGKVLSEKRATAMILRFTPLWTLARCIRRTRLGPIFPPAPRTITSPWSTRIASTSAAAGCDSLSSNCSSVSIGIVLIKPGKLSAATHG